MKLTLPLLLLVSLTIGCNQQNRSFKINTEKLSATITAKGISSIRIKSGNLNVPVASIMHLEGCETSGDVTLAKTKEGAVEIRRTILNPKTQEQCTLTERFSPEGETIRWEIEIVGAEKPWTTKICSGIKWPVNETSRFWAPWSDPRMARKESSPAGTPVQEQVSVPASDFNWGDPLIPHAFVDDTLWYGAPYYRYEEPHDIFIPYQRDLVVIPLVSALQKESDTGISLVLDPDDEILDMTLATGQDGSLVFNRIYNRISADHPLKFSMNLIAHEADWRGGLRWMSRNYPEYFNPTIEKAHEMAATSS